MEDINQKIDDILLKYQLDKYYPAFRKRDNQGNLCTEKNLSDIIPWNREYYFLNNSLQDGKYLMDRVDISVLEVNLLLKKLQEDINNKKEYLERLFFISICKRNFLLAEEVVDWILKDNPKEIKYRKAWEEVSALIEDIKKEVKNRTHQDIVGIWLDAVSYKDIKEIPYLERVRKSDNTVSFNNAYTMTPYTNPTFALIMTGKKRVDDQSYLIKRIDGSNSEVIALLEKENYICRFIGSYWKQIADQYRSDTKHYIYAPCSEMLWDMVYNLYEKKYPCFILTHILPELHWPYISMNQRKPSDCLEERRRLCGRQEVERQLRFYMDFIGEDTTKLYFSDHGDNWLSKEVFHTVLEIQGKNLEKEEINEIISYENFWKIFNQLILDKKIDKEFLVANYAEIQEVPMYDKRMIGRKIKGLNQLYSNEVWGYRGVIDHDFIYLCYKGENGILKESLIGNKNEDYFGRLFFPGFEDICDDEAITYYRKIAERKKIFSYKDINKYSYYLQKISEKALPRHIDKLNLIKKLFSVLPNHGVAVRGGGLDTGRILTLLERELKCVEYIIDNNENCVCAKLNIPIVSARDIEKYPIDVIILCSKKYSEEFIKESVDYPKNVQVLDVYKYLEDNGIIERNSFYYFQPCREDYDVGFPFEE
jgi:hypothetical protein